MDSPRPTLRRGSRARIVGEEPVPCWMATPDLTELLVETDLVTAPPATATDRPAGPVVLVASVQDRPWAPDVGCGSVWLVEWSVGQRLWQAGVESGRLVPDPPGP